jgi:hypothetical protein
MLLGRRYKGGRRTVCHLERHQDCLGDGSLLHQRPCHLERSLHLLSGGLLARLDSRLEDEQQIRSS